jgi:hypothetical protein
MEIFIISRMSIKDKYSVRSIPNEETKEWLLYKHYAKRLPPIEFAFGLFITDFLKGVITYGTPPSSNLRESFGDKFKLMELNRLCIDEGLEKNALSYFVSSSLKQLPAPLIIVSYADTAQNHHGYIYQATNWIYTGLSAKRTDWKIKGMEHLHGATIGDLSRGKEKRAEWMREKYGGDFYLEDRSRKHRYFYFIGNKKEVQLLNELLPYKKESYPKGDNQRYDASYKPTINLSLF